MVKIYFDVIRKVVRKSLGLACFMIPVTVAFALVGQSKFKDKSNY